MAHFIKPLFLFLLISVAHGNPQPHSAGDALGAAIQKDYEAAAEQGSPQGTDGKSQAGPGKIGKLPEDEHRRGEEIERLTNVHDELVEKIAKLRVEVEEEDAKKVNVMAAALEEEEEEEDFADEPPEMDEDNK